MKILFDQGTAVPLRRFLPGHTVNTAYERGWMVSIHGWTDPWLMAFFIKRPQFVHLHRWLALGFKNG